VNHEVSRNRREKGGKRKKKGCSKTAMYVNGTSRIGVQVTMAFCNQTVLGSYHNVFEVFIQI